MPVRVPINNKKGAIMDDDSMFIEQSTANYLRIHSDGTIREKTDKDDPKAKARDWSLPADKDGNIQSGTTYERIYSGVKGNIKNIYVADTKFGTTQLNIVVEGSRQVVLTVAMNSGFADSLLESLPNINMDQEVAFEPVAYVNTKGRSVRFVKITQNGQDVPSFYQKYDTVAKKSERLNGYPEPTGNTSTYTKEHWKLYFQQAKLFVLDDLKARGIIGERTDANPESKSTTEAVTGVIELDEIPF